MRGFIAQGRGDAENGEQILQPQRLRGSARDLLLLYRPKRNNCASGLGLP
jgi:hypothetical protein